MASFASVRHHGWRKQAAWTKKVVENNGQLCFRPPPQVAHASRLDQKFEYVKTFDIKSAYIYMYDT